ncbi:MAG: hypothetical protein JSR73_05245 [Proteobacteria bacterium]|nr:hypothetical protein [Pseudomonadota bacterium]
MNARAGRADLTNGRCRDCRFFEAGAVELEAALAGLSSLGSAFGSVRAADGLCRLHDRYLDGASRCERHSPVGPQRRCLSNQPAM